MGTARADSRNLDSRQRDGGVPTAVEAFRAALPVIAEAGSDSQKQGESRRLGCSIDRKEPTSCLLRKEADL